MQDMNRSAQIARKIGQSVPGCVVCRPWNGPCLSGNGPCSSGNEAFRAGNEAFHSATSSSRSTSSPSRSASEAFRAGHSAKSDQVHGIRLVFKYLHES